MSFTNKIIWLMGPTSSGKTTIAAQLQKDFRKRGISVIHYDGDEVRDFFGKGLQFGESDRLRVVSTIVHLANKALDAGLNVIVSALTANEDARAYVKNNANNLFIVSLKCSISRCIERDPKGMYQKAINGEIETLIGYNSPYNPPENPDLIIDTEITTIEDATAILVEKVTNSSSAE